MRANIRKLIIIFLMIINISANEFKIGKPFIQQGHTDTIYSIDIDKNDKYFATASQDGTIKIWDFKTQKLIRTLSVNTGAVFSVKFDNKFNRLFTGHGHRIRVWDLKTGKLIKTIKKHKYFVNSLDINEKLNLLVSGSGDRNIIIWDLKTLKIKHIIKKAHKYGVNSVKIDERNNLLFSGGRDGILKIWSLKNYKLKNKYSIGGGDIDSISINDDNKMLAFASSSGKIKIINLNTYKTIKTIKYKSDSLNIDVYFKNNNLIINGDTYSIKNNKIIDKITLETPYILSNNKQYLITQHKIINYSTKNRKLYNKNNSNKISILDLQNNKYLLSNGKNSIIRWDIETGQQDHIIKFNELEKFKSTKSLIYASKLYMPKIYMLNNNGKYLKSFNNIKKGWTQNIKISKDGKYIIISDTNYNLKHPNHIFIFNKNYEIVNKLIGEKFCIGKNSKYLIVFYSKKIDKYNSEFYIKKYDINNKKELFNKKGNYAISMAIDKNNKYIALGGYGYVKLYDFKTGKYIKSFKWHNSAVNAIVFSKDSKILYFGTDDDKITKWDIKKRRLIKIFNGHLGDVNTIVLLKDKILISGSSDGTIRYWDAKSGKELLKTVSFTNGEWISITPQGYFTASKNGAKYLSVLIRPMQVASIDQFYKKFYRPDLVKLALQGVNIKSNETLADVAKNKPAPQLSFIGIDTNIIKTDKDTYTIKIGAKDSGGGIGRVKVYINGVLVKTSDKALKLKKRGFDKIYKFNLSLEKGENHIKVLAWNKDESMQSNPLELTIKSDVKLKAPNLYVLIVGINKFENEEINLKYAVEDAKLFEKTLKSYSKQLFKNVYTKLLVSKKNTTKKSIKKAFKELSKRIKPNDYFVFYISSHGDIENGKYYLITSNVLFLDDIKETAISDNDIVELVGNIPSHNKIVIFDTCYAGDIGAKMASVLSKGVVIASRGLSQKDAIDLLNMESGASIFSASSSTQQALEGYNNHGLYTYFLAKGLSGAADEDKNGYIDLSELSKYVKRNVYKIAKKKFHRAQYPYSNLGIDVPISVVKSR